MSDTGTSIDNGSAESTDRRAHPRQQVRSLSYVKLDEGNGGIILNASEGGLAVHAVTSLMDDILPTVSFQISQSRSWVKLSARTAWTADSRKVAGLEFVALSDETRAQIREWLSSESGPPTFRAETEVLPEDRGRDSTPPSEAAEALPSVPEPEPIAAPLPTYDFAVVPEQRHEAETSASNWSYVETSQKSLETGNRKTLIVASVVITLVLISLLAGWAAGHGAFDNILGKIAKITGGNGATDRDAMLRSAGQAARVSEIEIVDANNQKWTISFNGPVSATPEITRGQSSNHASTQSSTPQIPFQTWVLSAPVRQNGTGDRDGLDKDNAPALTNLPNGADSSMTAPGLSLTAPQPAPPPQQAGADLRQGDLIRRVNPVYPPLARSHGIGGTVVVRATVGPDGIVRQVEFVSGPQMLADAAKAAVLQWRYTPTVLDGRAIETEKDISLVFQPPSR